MTDLRTRLSEFGWRRIALTIVVVIYFGVFAAMLRQLGAYPIFGWFENALGLFGDHKVAPHRLHDFALSLIFWTAGIGLLAQLRSPRKNAAGQVMALIPWVGLLIAFALTSYWDPLPIVAVFGGLTVLATILHPSGRELFASFRVSRLNRVLLALAIVAAVPLLAFASTQVGLQTGAIEPSHDHGGASHDHDEVHQEHIDAGHFTIMVAISLIVIGLALLASFRPDGWWVTAWMAGLVPIFIGLVSIVYSDAASSVDLLWAVGAVLWGFGFVIAGEMTQDEEAPTLLAHV